MFYYCLSIKYLNISNLITELFNFKYSKFSEICQKSVPQAIYCFLISNDFEDTLRNCVAIGGDTDTIGAMAGSIAEAYYESKKSSDFTSKFTYLLIDPSIEEKIKDFHMTIGSEKEI